MTKSVSRECPGCKTFVNVEINPAGNPACPKCSAKWPGVDEAKLFESCPYCQCRQYYVQKDFNRLLGCGVVLIGIVFVPATYGLSLPLVALIDWLIYRQVPTIVVCYRCGAEFRGFTVPSHLKTFMHHIGEKYERVSEKKHEFVDK